MNMERDHKCHRKRFPEPQDTILLTSASAQRKFGITSNARTQIDSASAARKIYTAPKPKLKWQSAYLEFLRV